MNIKQCIICNTDFELGANSQTICNKCKTRVCAICGKEFRIPAARLRFKRATGKYFCSIPCLNKFKVGKVFREPGFKLSDETKRKISEAHKGKSTWNKGVKPPEWVKQKMSLGRLNSEKVRGTNHYNWKGGKYEDCSGYVLLYQENHPNKIKKNYILEHRLVAEKCLNRYLISDEHIHHINGIKNDNRPENLYLFPSNSAHKKFHYLKIKPKLESNLL